MEINLLPRELVTEVVKDVYNDGAKPAVTEAGDALGSIVGLFNNIVLYPVKKANIKFKYKLQQFEDDIKLKIEKIPAEKIQTPSLIIAGPTLEALKYTYDTSELREMYLNLLSSSMNSDNISIIFPCFVDFIRQLSSLDANLFKELYKLNIHCVPIACISFDVKMGMSDILIYPKTFPYNIIDSHIDSPYNISASLTNLNRLGIIEIVNEIIPVESYYEKITTSQIVKDIEKYYKKLNSQLNLTIKRKSINITDLGKNFGVTCFD